MKIVLSLILVSFPLSKSLNLNKDYKEQERRERILCEHKLLINFTDEKNLIQLKIFKNERLAIKTFAIAFKTLCE